MHQVRPLSEGVKALTEHARSAQRFLGMGESASLEECVLIAYDALAYTR